MASSTKPPTHRHGRGNSAEGFAVTLDEAEIELIPGDGATVSLAIENHERDERAFVVQLVGALSDMGEPTRIDVPPDATGRASLELDVERATAAVPPGTHVLGVRVAREDDPLRTRVEEVAVTVGRRQSGRLRVSPRSLQISKRGRASVIVQNTGNTQLEVSLRARASSALRWAFTSSTLKIGPGETACSDLKVSAPRSLNQRYVDAVVVRPRGLPEAKSVRVEVIRRPLLTRGRVRLVGTAMAVALGAFGTYFLLNPTTPGCEEMNIAESCGTDGGLVTVPSVIGMPLSEAQRLLSDSGLEQAMPDDVDSTRLVVQQDPKGASVVEPEAKVTLTLASTS